MEQMSVSVYHRIHLQMHTYIQKKQQYSVCQHAYNMDTHVQSFVIVLMLSRISSHKNTKSFILFDYFVVVVLEVLICIFNLSQGHTIGECVYVCLRAHS